MDNSKTNTLESKKKRKRNKKPNQQMEQVSTIETTTNIPAMPDKTSSSITVPIQDSILVTQNSLNNDSATSGVDVLKEAVTTASAKPGPSESGKKKKGPNKSPKSAINEAASLIAATRCQASPTIFFQWSREENNLNLAVEENHNNLVVETNSLNRERTLPLDALNQNYDEVDNASVTMQNMSLASNPDLKFQDKKVEADHLPRQKTKAQLKAERRAAFEAQKAAEISAQKEEKLQKSKADLKAERRAIQEAQRAQKVGEQGGEKTSKPDQASTKPESQKNIQIIVKKPTVKLVLPVKDVSPTKAKVPATEKKTKSVQRKLRLFSHLPQHIWNPEISSSLGMASVELHPAIIGAGLQMAKGLVTGSNARCIATLAALKRVIRDYSTPPQKELSRELDSTITQHVGFLKKCRPLAASMSNAVKRLKFEITQIDSSFNDDTAKEKLSSVIDKFIYEDIVLANKGISQVAAKTITNNDVILTYACSSLVKQVLSDAHISGKKFRVIVVDSRPGLEGCEMLRYLVSQGICCTYVWINAVSYVIKEVTKVIMGCHSIQANGYVMSRAGSSQVALVANANSVPVLMCCETYKFCERVHTDSFICNELGDPEKFIGSTPLHKAHLINWKDISSLNVVSLTYDVMPAHLVTCVVSELDMLPCTSVPVVLRVKHEMHNNIEKYRMTFK